ncbi:hypothetical protein CRE_11497 [Caenorhabditis remanei]|uniref:Uncharacterized protein n=1 Tax=Caenorhabditis remanei TaxID=31234 RepID=E3NH37_CAERE|nr:hypothetical protein CRE_11497 [Caenorhabditis remanei]
MSSPLSNIKTESRPIWEQPPPPYIVLPELATEDPSRHITLQEYKMLACAPEIARQTWASVGQSCEAKQLLELTILHCFTEVPPLGKKRNSHQKVQDHYAIVAIKVWKRIEILYSRKFKNNVFFCFISQHASYNRALPKPEKIVCETGVLREKEEKKKQVVSGCLLAAKIGLRRRLRTFTIEKKLSKEKVEEKMWEWPLYLYMRTYRHKDYEKGLRTKALKDKMGSLSSITTDNIKKAPSALKRSVLLQVKQEEGEPPERIPQLNTSGSSLDMSAPSRHAPYFASDTSGSSQNMPGPHSSHSPKESPAISCSKRSALCHIKQEKEERPKKIPQVEPNISGSSRHVPAVSSQHQVAQYKPTHRDLPAPSRHVPGFPPDLSGPSQIMSGLSSSHSPSSSHKHRVPHYDPSLQDMLSYSPGPSYQQAQAHHMNQSGFLQQRDPLGHHKNVPTVSLQSTVNEYLKKFQALLSKTDQYHFNEDMEYLNRKLLRIHEKNETLYRAARDAVLEVTKAIERKTPPQSLESVFLGLAEFFKDVKVPE